MSLFIINGKASPHVYVYNFITQSDLIRKSLSSSVSTAVLSLFLLETSTSVDFFNIETKWKRYSLWCNETIQYNEANIS